MRWPNEDIENFTFDVFKNEDWHRFLKTYRDEDGRLLPRTSEHGDPYVYEVYVWGVPRWLLPTPHGGAYRRFFPIDKDGNKLPLPENGRL
jgi:hypothetical protein